MKSSHAHVGDRTATNASGASRPADGCVIARVATASAVQRMGLCRGDHIIRVNGTRVRDALDLLYETADCESLTVDLLRNGEALTVAGPCEDGFRVHLEGVSASGLRTCNNKCIFCFVDRLPPGLRKSLYVKDDDYRASVLDGAFVTLANLTSRDWDRIERMRPSPLRVSVHATDVNCRRTLLGNARAPDIMSQLARLTALGVTVHCQIVVVPGINDGDVLRRSLSDLAGLWPGVASVAVVPVGLTACGSGSQTVRELTTAESLALIAMVGEEQARQRARTGVGFVYAADDLYLRCGLDVPSSADYDDYPQYHNGVGMVREFLEDFGDVVSGALPRQWPPKVTIVCGMRMSSVMRVCLSELGQLTGAAFQVLPVENRFFGESVTTSGLLTWSDVGPKLAALDDHGLVVLPRWMLDAAGRVTLDDVPRRRIRNSLGGQVLFASRISELVRHVKRQERAGANLED